MAVTTCFQLDYVMCYCVPPHHEGDTLRTLTPEATLTDAALYSTAVAITRKHPLLCPLHGREVFAALTVW